MAGKLMRTPIASAILLLGSLVTSHMALAAPTFPPPPPTPFCPDFPEPEPAYALGQYASVSLAPSLESTLDAHLADIVTPRAGDPPQISRGAVLMVGRHGAIVYHKAIGLRDGNTSLGGDPTAAMQPNSIFDLESMTKPFTAAVILRMHELRLLDIDDLVIDYLPEFELTPDPSNPSVLISDPDKATTTIRDMLRYMSGLDVDAGAPIYGVADPYRTMSHEPSYYPAGTSVVYSDLAYRLLGHIAEVAYANVNPTPKTFRQLVSLYITGPLQMTDTDFEPALTMPAKMGRVAGTGKFAHYGLEGAVPLTYQWGEVQDDHDWWTMRHDSMFPGVSPTGTGCDGLFSTAFDLAKLAQLLLDNGEVADPPNCMYQRVLSPSSVAGLTTIQTVDGSGVPIGDPAPSGYTVDLLFGDKTFGLELMDGSMSVGGSWLRGVYKTGGAGTFLLIDPTNDLFIVVLTNHGLPDLNDFGTEFDAMIEEIGPHRIADSVALAIQD
jgi:CubicO group peptidase (beta-lactamase class C family)